MTTAARDLDAGALLALAGELRWDFPTSQGTPVREVDERLERAVAGRDAGARALRSLPPDAAAELAARTWRLWVVARDDAAGREALAPMLEADAPPTRARALALYGDSLLAFRLGALDDARRRAEAALETSSAVGDTEALALAHLALSRVALADGDAGRGRSLAARALELAHGLDPAFEQAPLHLLAQATRLAGDYDAAAELFRASLALNRRIGDAGMATVELHNLGHVELHRRKVCAAAELFAECEAYGGGDPASEAFALLNRAAVACASGELERARELLSETESALEAAGVALAPDDAFELAWLRERLA